MEEKKMEKNLGNLIKSVRLEKNLTQEELAALCDITKSAVEKTENNQSVSIFTLEFICQSLDIRFSN